MRCAGTELEPEEEETEVDQRNGASQLILKQNKLCESQSQIKKNELMWKERCAELDHAFIKTAEQQSSVLCDSVSHIHVFVV